MPWNRTMCSKNFILLKQVNILFFVCLLTSEWGGPVIRLELVADWHLLTGFTLCHFQTMKLGGCFPLTMWEIVTGPC